MKLTILPPVPTTTSILAPDPFPPTRSKFVYGAGGSIVTKGGLAALYPDPLVAIVNEVTTPANTFAITDAPIPTPRVSAIETLGALRYPDPPVERPIDWIEPLETDATASACLGTWYPLPIPTENSLIIPPFGKSPFGPVPVKSIVCPTPVIW